MSAKSELRAWVESHATDTNGVRNASKLIATYVAECVKHDRAKQPSARKFQDMAEALINMGRAWP